MDKRIRQYIGLASAIIVYYVIHEGAHLLYALSIDVFKQINFIGLGVQIDVYADRMTSLQMAIFCLLGSIATLAVSYVLVLFSNKVKDISSKVINACLYYITIALLFLDPLYLSVICGFVGGGDMNGISMLFPEIIVRIVFGSIFIANVFIFKNIVLPRYKEAFDEVSV